ncbi:MAG: N-acetylneuraminate synthase family protein [Anaerolineae bacterium]|nr:N-acetylneuraminate synthase family protein [Anaerolineae bacterium]
MRHQITIGKHVVGDGSPVFIIAEIGINHNGDINIAKRLIDAAVLAGCNAIKLQKRTPELCVPPEQQSIMRETPWGLMTYLEYRHRIELNKDQYIEIASYCHERGIEWFASPWDEPSVDFLEQFGPACYKIASASLTDHDLLQYVRSTGRPIILSTGMSTPEQIDLAINILGLENLAIMHATSTYPCPPEQLNLRMIPTLREKYPIPIGYSGHETGLQTTIAAVVLGSNLIERHITLDRAMWGSDQAASIEPHGFMRLVRDIRIVETALGDGQKRVYDSEVAVMKKLRRNVNNPKND